MSIRKLLPLMIVALALLSTSAAFAADAPPVSEEDFLSSLQTPSDQDETALPEVDEEPAPQMKHASGACTYLGVRCKACSGGYQACDVYRCPYGGTTHLHWYCSGACTNPCSI